MTTTIEPVTKTPADRSGARRLGVIGLALTCRCPERSPTSR